MKAILIVLYLKKKVSMKMVSDLRAIIISPMSHMHAFYRIGYSHFQSLLLTWVIAGEIVETINSLKHMLMITKNAIETLSLFPRIAVNKVVSDDSFDNKIILVSYISQLMVFLSLLDVALI